ncbi:MAG: hypothetical protein KUG68_00520 [Flavobacteriaceae bacterium]|nr:hypothetical protein [Flavobacteriaceae bacterium]
MKKNLFIKAIIVAVLFFTVMSCDNEKFEGEIIEEFCTFRFADLEEIRADINGDDFRVPIDTSSVFLTGNSAVLVIHFNGFTHLSISGNNTLDNNRIQLNINSPAIGTFDLLTDDIYGSPPNNNNNHEALESFGYYLPNIPADDSEIPSNPYVTYMPNGGFGVAELTELNLEEQYASGTFSFTGKRVKKDPLTGEPILDGSGNEIIETIELECGNFNRIPYTIVEFDEDTANVFTSEFFAKVDDVDFNPISIMTQRHIVNDELIVNVRANNGDGDLIRIDIPESLTEGTYEMESISDGTQLIGMFNPATTASENLTSNPGTITITNINTFTGLIEATFSFTGTDPLGIDPSVVQVTEGSFSVDYIPEANINNVIIADVNGETYVSNSAGTTTSQYNGITRYQFTSIDSDTNESIRLIVPSTIEIGTYDISDTLITGEEILAYYTNDSGVTSNLIANSGTLTVEQLNEDTGVIEGVFEFTTIDISVDPPVEYVITSGEFSLALQ